MEEPLSNSLIAPGLMLKSGGSNGLYGPHIWAFSEELTAFQTTSANQTARPAALDRTLNPVRFCLKLLGGIR